MATEERANSTKGGKKYPLYSATAVSNQMFQSLKGYLLSLRHHITSLQWSNTGTGSPEEFRDVHPWRFCAQMDTVLGQFDSTIPEQQVGLQDPRRPLPG